LQPLPGAHAADRTHLVVAERRPAGVRRAHRADEDRVPRRSGRGLPRRVRHVALGRGAGQEDHARHDEAATAGLAPGPNGEQRRDPGPGPRRRSHPMTAQLVTVACLILVLALPGMLVGAAGGLRGWLLLGTAPVLTYG